MLTNGPSLLTRIDWRVLALASILTASVRPVAAEYGNSLDWAPADASVYSTSLRLKEQIDRVANSNAWKKLLEIPSVAAVWQMAEMQINNPNGPAAMFWQLMELPENQQLAKLLGEMFSDEVAFYAGADFEKFLELAQIVQGSRLAPALQAMQGENPNAGDARVQMVAEALEEDPSLVHVPQMVFAFRVKDKDAAKTQLKRLEVFANMMLQQTELDAEFEPKEIGDAEFLVLELNGSMIPWEEEAPAGVPIDDETYQNLKEIISDKKLAVALGTWKEYVVLSFGESSEHLAKLGDGPFLVDREEFEPLKPHLDKKYVAVQYISRAVMSKQQLAPQDLDDWASLIEETVKESNEVPEELKERLGPDLSEMADDLKAYLVAPGAMAGCVLLTDAGYESFTYNWTPQPRLDASQPLEMVQHLGGSPIIALAARGTHDPADYDVVAKWVRKAFGYFEDFALEEMDADERVKAEQALAVAKPLLRRLDKANREHLVPALKDSQSAIVIDADVKSKKWHDDMPASFTPLPMAELAIVLGVSDVEAFNRAMAEYKAVADDLVDAIREQDPDAIPADYEIPDPKTTSTEGGTLHAWDFGDEAGLDEQIALCGAVGEHVVAIATSADLAERVLAHKPLESLDALGANDEPRAVVAGLNWADLMATVGPWVEYGIRLHAPGAEGAEGDPADDPEEIKEICSQVRSGLEILQCFRGAWSETREEDGVWVTHTVTTFQDLEE